MAAPFPDEADDLLKVDYYSLLNVGREASKDEINQAYKRLSKVYHPDKHQDPLHKKNAENLFSKLKKAHEILVDEHKRVIYDLYGEKGLESFGMEVISRTKTPAEIIAEYERFQQEQEERRLRQRTNPKGNVTIEINATDLFEPYDDYDEEIHRHGLGVEISNMSVNHSVECPLTNKDTAILSGAVSVKEPYSSGVFMASWRRLLQGGGWTEAELSLGNRTSPALRLKASSQLFRRCIGTVTTTVKVTDEGLSLGGLMGVLTYQFDKHIQGRMVFNMTGVRSAVIYNTENHEALVAIQVGLKATYGLLSYSRKFPDIECSVTGSVRGGTFGAQVEYGVAKKISMFSTVEATMAVGYPTGVSLRIKVDRGQQTFLFPIALSEEIVPSAVFYGTVAPVVIYFIVKNLIVNPFLNEQKEKELEKTKQEQTEKVTQRKKEAEALIKSKFYNDIQLTISVSGSPKNRIEHVLICHWSATRYRREMKMQIDLMKETVERSIEVEEKKNGLVIVKALYGKLVADNQEDLVERQCIDVTIPLQALVKDSKLISPEKNSKSSLPGFYDPCIGEDKRLYIRYRFRGRLHHVTLDDTDFIRLPQQKHIVKDDEELTSSSSYSTFSTSS